jgi:starvation-inducible outer membrane lipoprotein|nr:hypothetical protein [uncultured Dongia sp.]
MKKLILMVVLAASLAACTSSPAKIKADEELPPSPCACGPRIYPLMQGMPA